MVIGNNSGGLYKSTQGKRLITDYYGMMPNDWPVPHGQDRISTQQGETFVVESGSKNKQVLAVVAGWDVMLDPFRMKQRIKEHIPKLNMHYLPEARHFPGSQADPMSIFLFR